MRAELLVMLSASILARPGGLSAHTYSCVFRVLFCWSLTDLQQLQELASPVQLVREQIRRGWNPFGREQISGAFAFVTVTVGLLRLRRGLWHINQLVAEEQALCESLTVCHDRAFRIRGQIRGRLSVHRQAAGKLRATFNSNVTIRIRQGAKAGVRRGQAIAVAIMCEGSGTKLGDLFAASGAAHLHMQVRPQLLGSFRAVAHFGSET